MKTWTGGCLCGAVRYEIETGAPENVYCHCRMCQKWTGSVVNTGAVVAKSALRLTQGEPKYYQSSRYAERGFCPECGTSMTYRLLKPEPSPFLVMNIPVFDEPEKLAPVWHGGVENQMPWLKIHDDLPRMTSMESPALQKAWESVGRDDPQNWTPKSD